MTILKPLLPNPDPDMAGTMLVPLTRGYVAIIDGADAELVGRYNWHVLIGRKTSATLYAITNVRLPGDGKRTTLSLHRLVCQGRERLDHVNTNGLDCRRENLRPAKQAQNVHNTPKRRHNTSGYKGVTWHAKTGKWRAQSELNGKHLSIGLFDTPEQAGRAYAAKMRELHGEFAQPFTHPGEACRGCEFARDFGRPCPIHPATEAGEEVAGQERRMVGGGDG